MWIGAIACVAAVLVLTMAWFLPTNAQFATKSIALDQVPARLDTWLMVGSCSPPSPLCSEFWQSLGEDGKAMTKIIHPIAGVIAIVTIATFWLSTAMSELFGSEAAVIAVKTAIPWGFLLLVPALAAAGGSGFALAQGRWAGLVGAKIKRMPFIAANGILILIPAALFLASKARAAEFDTTFYAVQALELVAGAANITLLGLNMRDGLRMKGRLRRRSA